MAGENGAGNRKAADSGEAVAEAAAPFAVPVAAARIAVLRTRIFPGRSGGMKRCYSRELIPEDRR